MDDAGRGAPGPTGRRDVAASTGTRRLPEWRVRRERRSCCCSTRTCQRTRPPRPMRRGASCRTRATIASSTWSRAPPRRCSGSRRWSASARHCTKPTRARADAGWTMNCSRRTGAPSTASTIAGHAFVLRIDVPSDELRRCHELFGVSCSAFMTAWNPRSTPTPREQNEAAMARLEQALAATGLPLAERRRDRPRRRVARRAELPGVRPRRAAGVALARRFDQNAIVWSGADATPRLVMASAAIRVRHRDPRRMGIRTPGRVEGVALASAFSVRRSRLIRPGASAIRRGASRSRRRRACDR